MIVVDVETTGLDPKTCSIVSIGALDFQEPENRFYGECRIFDGAEVQSQSLLVGGFSRDSIVDPKKPSLEELMKQFLVWTDNIGDRMLAGHNPAFDRDFLEWSARRYHLSWPFAHRTIDLHSLCYYQILRRGIPPPSHNNRSTLNLDAVAEYVGIPRRIEGAPHNALTDALITAEALWRLCYDEPHLPEFSKYPVPWVR
jgi:DNA polymerase III epsilon subunit-like protein